MRGRGCLSFFFQAEDGIRDDLVTGVQTCALPISPRHCAIAPAGRLRNRTVAWRIAAVTAGMATARSEERRVGKECRTRGSACDIKKKSGPITLTNESLDDEIRNQRTWLATDTIDA